MVNISQTFGAVLYLIKLLHEYSFKCKISYKQVCGAWEGVEEKEGGGVDRDNIDLFMSTSNVPMYI